MSSEDKLPSCTPDETVRRDVVHPTTGDDVASVEETTASADSPQQHEISCQCVEETRRRGTMVLVVTTTPLARPSTSELSSLLALSDWDVPSTIQRGTPELLDEIHPRAPEGRHGVSFVPTPYMTSQYEITNPSDLFSSRNCRIGIQETEGFLNSPPSPPASIPAETTGHSDTMSHRASNERDQKDMERRDDVQGGFADVVVIEDVSTRALAVRKASKSEDYGDGLRVCKILSNLNVIIFLRAVRESEDRPVKFILEFGPYGTVRELFRGKECFQPPARMSYFLKHTIHGMSYLHQHGIIHGAINGDNVAVYLNGQCKLTNFDQAIPVKDVWKEREKKGTWCYSSPELIADPKCSYPADVWSAMLLFVVMMTGEAPWHSSIEKAVSSERYRYLKGTILITSYFEKKHYLKLVNESLYRERLQAEFGNAPEYARQLAIFNELAALARKVLVRDPSQRPSADDLLNSLVMIRASTYIVKT